MRRFASVLGVCFLLVAGVVPAQAASVPSVAADAATRPMIMMRVVGSKPARPHRGSNQLYFHGGSPAVETSTGGEVYLVFWGSQWNNSDPSGEAQRLQNFFHDVGGSSWNNSVTQYCQGVAVGTTVTPCTGSGAATNPTGVFATYWYDNAAPAPTHPTQSQLAAEAVNAASHFSNVTAQDNAKVQYVIATATGNNSTGFGTQYCAWHSSTNSTIGTIAYTNMPYITDAGTACGANFNGLGPDAGITIVGGHEFAETETDIFPNGGWLDGNGSENGDKCAWITSGQGAATSVTLSGNSYPLQSLWSNAYNSGSGGCVLSYP